MASVPLLILIPESHWPGGGVMMFFFKWEAHTSVEGDHRDRWKTKTGSDNRYILE
jgi:hypothetical protein